MIAIPHSWLFLRYLHCTNFVDIDIFVKFKTSKIINYKQKH